MSGKPLRRRVGRQIRRALDAKGWPQAQLARELGIADAQVNRWVNGRVMPSPRNLERIAAALDVPVSFLFQNDEP